MSPGTNEITPATETESGEAPQACATRLPQHAASGSCSSAVPPDAAADHSQPQSMSLVQLVDCIAARTSTDSSGGDPSTCSSSTASIESQLQALQELASRARSAAPELSDHHPLASPAKLKQTAVAGVVSLLQQHSSGDQAAPAAVAIALEALLALSRSATSYKSRIAKQPGALRALAMLLQGASSSSGEASAEAPSSSDAALRLSLAADAIRCLAWDGLAGHAQNQLRIAAQPGLIGGLVALLTYEDREARTPQATHLSDKSATAAAANGQQQQQQQQQHSCSTDGSSSTDDVIVTTVPAAPEPVVEAATGWPAVSAASVRRKAAHALACICARNACTQSAVAATPGAIRSLVGMLHSPDAGERLQAADAMAQLLIVRAAGGRLQLLHRPNQQAMGETAGALQGLLASVMADADSGVRLQAQAALTALVQGSQDNADRLKAALKEAQAAAAGAAAAKGSGGGSGKGKSGSVRLAADAAAVGPGGALVAAVATAAP